MPSYSWVKLYIEVLDDPKMGRMTDDLWRRTIEVILMAGRSGNNGALPPLEDMAWTFRLSREQLESDLMKLAQVNIVRLEDGIWHVVNFARRQAAIDTKDRVAQYRNRAKKHDYYEEDTREKHDGNELVTTRYTDTDKNRLDTDTETDKNRSAACAALPRPAQTYIDAGGKFQSGKLQDGTTKKDNAIRVICETVKDDDASIDLWRRVVSAYCAQWSSKSYTIMLNEYYTQGRVPGQTRNGNGNGQHAQQSNALAALERMKERHSNE